MARIAWSFDAFVPLEPARAFAWIADHRPDDHQRPAYRRAVGATPSESARATREVLSREGPRVRVRDAWNGRTMEFDVLLRADDLAMDIEGPMGYRARWSVAPNPGGARVRVEGDLAPSGIAGLLAPLFRRRFLRQMELDFRGHVADMVATLNPEGAPLASGDEMGAP